jgi:hypothetical protein
MSMPSSLKVQNIREALTGRLFPSVTVWNRLEGRPRTVSFDRALRAEVRDALWMLTKQWQMGEFRGSDAGSPAFAKLQIDTTRLTKYQPDAAAVQPFEYEVPLEGKVERRPVPLVQGNRPVALDLRLLMGRQWLALIKGIGTYEAAFIARYPIAAPDPTRKEDADRCAHPEVWQWYAAVAGRAMDGAALHAHLKASAANRAYDGIAVAASDRAALDERAARFLAWFDRQFLQPPATGDDAWLAERLEYQFSASAPIPGGEKVYVAEAYCQGRLDWYSLDIDATRTALDAVPGSEVTGLPEDAGVRTMIPTPVSFSGMPNTRWWSFEDRKTNFGDINASTGDLPKLLFLEFALVYSNDWFLIPYTLPAGAIATIRGFAVKTVFGERFWIAAADQGLEASAKRWGLFTINTRGSKSGQADTSLLVLPTVPKIQQSAPTEDILLIRDEVANMVWGVEKVVPLASGESKPGVEAARQTRAYFEGLLARAPGASPPVPAVPLAAPVRYNLMTTVPENWIPLIPVHVPGDNRKIQLQRAALPRILEGDPDPPVKVRPRTVLLRQGLDQDPPEPYLLHEEEVPRAGARILQCYQRTRWTDGQVYTWLRVQRQTGRGEGASGLAFDQLEDVPDKSAQ